LTFTEIVDQTIQAVVRCLFLSLSENPENRLDPHDHAGINHEFKFLFPVRNAKHNTYLTRSNVGGNHNSLFVGKGDTTSANETRISAIVSQFITEATSNTGTSAIRDELHNTVRFNSPIYIAQKILTDPEAIETRQIASFYARLWLIEKKDIVVTMHPSQFDRDGINRIVKFSDLDDLYTTIGKFSAGRDNLSNYNNPVQHFLGSLLAADGVLEHRLAWASSNYGPSISTGYRDDLKSFENLLWNRSEFRLSDRHLKPPSIADLANFVFGIPIAVSGLNELLNGGLKQGAGEGTVTLIRGGAGSGKTTLCISIQRAFEALRIPTIFISSEESDSAILARRDSVLNIPQKNHSAYGKDSAAFQIITTYSSTEEEKDQPGISQMVRAIAESLSKKKGTGKGPAQFSRLLVVIDGIHNYLEADQQKDIRNLIEECRSTNTHVLISSSDEWALSQGMEYFVDNFIKLGTTSHQDPMPHVERKIQLVKTRHQSSLIGEHRMQFKDEGDLSFTPNFSAILKAQSKTKALPPDQKTFSRPFQLESDIKGKRQKRSLYNLDFYDRSMTLVYGRGSANKTSLCLKMLCAPNIEGPNPARRVLVVSFLAPDSYYQSKRRTYLEKLEASIRNRLSNINFRKDPKDITDEEISQEIGSSLNVEIDTLQFTPGMITAEEVYSEISARISHFSISQNRYSGILIDGMHNVFVQFPQIESHPELWSALMNLTRRVGIKSVWTFTDFEVWGARTLTTVDYESIRSKPLLTALSQSIDYGFAVVPAGQVSENKSTEFQPDLFERSEPGTFIVSSFMSHAQASPTDFLLWDRTTEEIIRP
tara:strand:- start:1738 stop:4203 length:2466 start_codon:yes stop_codon:yes gene_type:complete